MAKKAPPGGSDEPSQPGPRESGNSFDRKDLDRSIIALPLLAKMEDAKPNTLFNVIIDVNLEFADGRDAARLTLWEMIDALPDVTRTGDAALDRKRTEPVVLTERQQGINSAKSKYSHQYLFGRLSKQNIQELVRRCDDLRKKAKGRGSASPLYRIWLDDEVRRFTNLSISTVKADAARNAFGTSGRDIVWAVVDTGVDGTHVHFEKHDNLDLKAPLRHRDFTSSSTQDAELEKTACIDKAGHGTHVAGIIAGECTEKEGKIIATVQRRNEAGDAIPETIDSIKVMSGMAPQCKILSLKVLDDDGHGLASNLIAAIEYIQELNGGGRRIRVHGVNMSVGYDFEPKWFACGQSPLCVEVDRLVRSGVVVVVAAGNTGYGFSHSLARGPVPAGQDVTINDPGNAELAITVGSTHRDMPHIYGVSFFSSKGPTGDGRFKPDIVAPGEKIISCESSNMVSQGEGAATTADAGASRRPKKAARVALYREDSGTSMAAPHVSGVIAAFLSVRREFIGRPEAVKQIFMSTATDLKRAVYFQGKGLVDLMRAIQSI